MKLELVFNNLKPPSVNHCFFPVRGRIGVKAKTKKYKDFISDIVKNMQHQNNDIKLFRDNFNELTDCLNINWVYHYNYIKKNGGISKTAQDVTNCLKTSEDSILGYIGIDDSYVVSGSFKKVQSKLNKIECTIESMPFSKFCLSL